MSEKTQPTLVIEDPTTTRLDRLKKSLRKPTRTEVGMIAVTTGLVIGVCVTDALWKERIRMYVAQAEARVAAEAIKDTAQSI